MDNNFNSHQANTEENTQISANQQHPQVNNEQQTTYNQNNPNHQQPPYLNNAQQYNTNNATHQQSYGYNGQQGNAYGPQQPSYGAGGPQQQAPYGYGGTQQQGYPNPYMYPYGSNQPQPGFGGSIKLFFSQYAKFSGRSRRQEYWYVVLFTFLVGLVCNITGLSVLSSVASLVFFIPNLALQCRRLHDIGRTGHWIWLDIISSIMLTFSLIYMIMCMIVYIPGVSDELAKQGIDTYALYQFYSIVDIPYYIVIVFVILALAIKITFLVFNCTDSNKGTNQYGPSQKYPDINSYQP